MILLRIRGAVQGVGFRPFVLRLARELDLTGWVRNDGLGVEILAAGDAERLAAFERRIGGDAPPAARIDAVERAPAAGPYPAGFEIRESPGDGPRDTEVMADLATCPDCRRELLDPADRRHRYPFLNCTHCGPRFSMITAIPYDRPNTTMAGFAMCARCRAEYENPADRRYHAQPIACPDCGPHLALLNAAGVGTCSRDEALSAAVALIRDGGIVAVKGLGGFHLVCDATNAEAVRELRRRKRREEKPLAVMFADADCAAINCSVSTAERALLESPAAPIVLLAKHHEGDLAAEIAPGNPCLGALLPYTPIHLLLVRSLERPVVATSGNLSEEPICTENGEAVNRLRGIADAFLVHNRPIARPVDDSVVRVIDGRTVFLRRSRGYAPLTVPCGSFHAERPVLAVGGQLKNAVGLATASGLRLSQHVGDLETEASQQAFEEIAGALPALFDVVPGRVACDLHPDYASTIFASGLSPGPVTVQHHHAHILAVMAEHGVTGEVLGVAWDGTGYGTDGTIWGGEFLRCDVQAFRRVAHLRPFPLPGGEAAVREPRRCALGLAWAAFGDGAFETDPWSLRGFFSATEWATLRSMLRQHIQTPMTTSMGRLFDGVAALLQLRSRSAYEGQSALLVEHAAAAASAPLPPAVLDEDAIDWTPLLQGLVGLRDAGHAPGGLAAGFHDRLVDAILAVARREALPRVVLGGGCFQNARLLASATAALRAAGFEVLLPREAPANDGGLALGQLWHAVHRGEAGRP